MSISRHWRFVLVGMLLLACGVAYALTAGSRVVSSRYDLCTACGTYRATKTVAGLELGVELAETEQSRWMLAQAGGPHDHSWVFSHTRWKRGVGCGCPNRAYYPLWLARERVGDDPELLALVREFLAVGDTDAQRREEIVARAAQL